MARIIVIDDEAIIVEVIEGMLTAAGHEVTTAGDGWEAMKRFRPSEHELVITDVCMPQVDGADLVRVLHREAPHVPVLVVTGHEVVEKDHRMAPIHELMNGLGAARVIQKPFSADQLIAEVDALLAKRAH